ncbi:MAG: hypothetical protein DI538_30000 [Azospira oryzae]|nr:MAG: hypothetical protein DI538_30000 [Azospira oryzae]
MSESFIYTQKLRLTRGQKPAFHGQTEKSDKVSVKEPALTRGECSTIYRKDLISEDFGRVKLNFPSEHIMENDMKENYGLPQKNTKEYDVYSLLKVFYSLEHRKYSTYNLILSKRNYWKDCCLPMK